MRTINFYSGPSLLPNEVREQLALGVIDYEGKGFSIAEISHRSQTFLSILEELTHLVKTLLQIEQTHEVVFVQGGGRQLFAQIPMNFLNTTETAGFIDTGYWAHKAMQYASYYGNTICLATSKNEGYNHIPTVDKEKTKGLKYVGITSNNTVFGTQYKTLPKVFCPLVVDMSSDIFSITRNWNEIDLAFACAQKNVGVAGMSVVIIKKEFLATQQKNLVPVFSFQNLIEKKSNDYTPPVLSIYSALLTMRWLKNLGGITAIEQYNAQKAQLLYTAIEESTLFLSLIEKKEDRSVMNVCFYGANNKIEQDFLQFCEHHHIMGIKGHQEALGFRASLYNAQTLDNVLALTHAMNTFEEKY
jgi:phosphoserine aminotransferase